MYSIRVFTGMPLVDGGVILHPRIAADPRALPDHLHQFTGFVGSCRLFREDEACLPTAIFLHRLHELIRDTHRVVGILELYAVIRAAMDIEGSAVTRINQRPSLLLLFL